MRKGVKRDMECRINGMFRMVGISHLHRRCVIQRLEESGITFGMPPVLDYLSQHEGCMQKDLANDRHLDPATISNVLSNMENNGQVTRSRAPGNRRALQVFLTDEGRRLAALVDEVHEEYENICFSGFTQAEKETFHAMLDRIESNLKASKGKEVGKE